MIPIFLLILWIPLYADFISYGGMTIFCDQECGLFLDGADLSYTDEIKSIMKTSIPKIFRNDHPIMFITGPGFNFYPWIYNEPETFTVYDWQATNGLDVCDPPTKTYYFGDYPSFLELAQAFRADCRFYWHDIYFKELALYRSVLSCIRKDLREESHWSVELNEKGELEYDYHSSNTMEIKPFIREVKERISFLESQIENALPKYEQNRELLEEIIRKVDGLFRDMFLWCLENHQPEGIALHAAIEEFIDGDFESGIEKIRWLIKTAETYKVEDELLSKLYLIKGQIESEYGLYSDAIIGLTLAIQKNPSMKEAYFERAAAYFELGKFDKAIEDYITSGFHSKIASYTDLSFGITSGIVQGAGESALEFIPSMLGTLRGLGGGLWALVKDPIGASNEFAAAAIRCVAYIKTHSSATLIQNLVPELKELVENYDQLEDFQKGKLIGHVLGKYGMDIFLAKEGTALIKAYRDMKKANQLMTLEALATPEKSAAILVEADQRWKRVHVEALRNGDIKIHPQKQGAHIIGHPEYERRLKLNETPSILEHPDPNRLLRERAGTGIKDRRAGVGDLTVMPGYVEIVDFGEIIGYAVEEGTKIKRATTMGKIHYAKNGAHIVPFFKK